MMRCPVTEEAINVFGCCSQFLHVQSQIKLGEDFIMLLRLLSCLTLLALLARADARGPIAKTIVVSQKGGGDFTSIQAAIDSIPGNGTQWTKVHVAAGVYSEKVFLTAMKAFIFLEGEGSDKTSIEWGDYNNDPKGHNTETSATFTTYAANFAASGIAFKNTYKGAAAQPAVAVLVAGDKSAFYECSFSGIQDTLADHYGRHYFKDCTIEGAIDFIFGINGQSIYEGCTLTIVTSKYSPGFVTAQGRLKAADMGGFVFKSCLLQGSQSTYLGRAWGAYSRVIFYKTFMADVVVPQGWDAWYSKGSEKNTMYAESKCTGPGSNVKGRVSWEKKPSDQDLQKYISLSFVDTEGWINAQPVHQ